MIALYSPALLVSAALLFLLEALIMPSIKAASGRPP